MFFKLCGQHGTKGQHKWCYAACMGEENARFVLTIIFFTFYLLVGATAFQWLENVAAEKPRGREQFCSALKLFCGKCNGTMGEVDVRLLLHSYGHLFVEGTNSPNQQHVPFIESLDFVTTAVTTIGFGTTTPQSVSGKVFFIVYAVLGCSTTLLLLNSFLERTITLLARVLRHVHQSTEDKCCRYLQRYDTSAPRQCDDEWKPPLNHVLICILLLTTTMVVFDSFFFSVMEGWTYVDSVYFCFVAFSTIGFGDYVPGRTAQKQVIWYRVASLLLTVSGSCCFYSLFCVLSIALKKLFGSVIVKVFCKRTKVQPGRKILASRRLPEILKKVFAASISGRRNFIFHRRFQPSGPRRNSATSKQPRCRRNSDEVPELRELPRSNHMSLVMMQKELHDLAQMKRNSHKGHCGLRDEEFGTADVGSVAIIETKIEFI